MAAAPDFRIKRALSVTPGFRYDKTLSWNQNLKRVEELGKNAGGHDAQEGRSQAHDPLDGYENRPHVTEFASMLEQDPDRYGGISVINAYRAGYRKGYAQMALTGGYND